MGLLQTSARFATFFRVTSVSGLKPQLLVVRRKLGQSAIAGSSSISSVTGTKPGSAAGATPAHIVTSVGQKQDRQGKP
jgi:hypothetical protein